MRRNQFLLKLPFAGLWRQVGY